MIKLNILMTRKVYLLLIFTVFSVIILYAQKKNGQNNKIRNYYQHINRAELDIIDTNYTEALSEYSKAFELKYPNGKDLYNAFVVSFYLKDTANAYNYYNWLAYHGMKRDYFSDSASKPKFYKYITAAHDSSRAAGYSNLK